MVNKLYRIRIGSAGYYNNGKLCASSVNFLFLFFGSLSRQSIGGHIMPATADDDDDAAAGRLNITLYVCRFEHVYFLRFFFFLILYPAVCIRDAVEGF